ncbi:Rhodanese- sulfurtransferase [Microbotryomycetes sp. JL221]|nr:Rhodanese- sulfurtransferase [Microbotryomycetes sp. JL221]
MAEPMDVTELLKATSDKHKAIDVPKEIPVEFDLGLLAVFDPNPIDEQDYSQDREQTLLQHARDGIQLLINQIWNKPTKIVDDQVIAELPPVATALPREKPLPKPKPMTKWEAFAKAKGIASKSKKDRLVFDEDKQEWVPSWGYKGKNKQLEQQWITEVPAGKDDNFDPVQNAKQERKARTQKNEQQRLKNLQRAAAANSPASSSAAVTASRISAANERETKKKMLERQLKVTKKSTASLGRFDETLKGEGREKNIKRKFAPNEIDSTTERSQALNILTSIGATTSNKRTKRSDDAPDANRDVSSKSLLNERKAIKKLTGGRGAMSLSHGDKKGKKIPFNILIALGSWLLWQLGYGILTFSDCKQAHQELMIQIQEAKVALKEMGVEVDS